MNYIYSHDFLISTENQGLSVTFFFLCIMSHTEVTTITLGYITNQHTLKHITPIGEKPRWQHR